MGTILILTTTVLLEGIAAYSVTCLPTSGCPHVIWQTIFIKEVYPHKKEKWYIRRWFHWGFSFRFSTLDFPLGRQVDLSCMPSPTVGAITPTVAKRHTVPIWQGEGQAYWDCLHGLLPAAPLSTTNRNGVTSSKLGFGSALFLFGNWMLHDFSWG